MANLYMRFPGGKPKAFTMSYDDGMVSDVQLMETMNRYGLKGTFNINSGLFVKDISSLPEGTLLRHMTREETLAAYTNSGHEIAVHGVEHPFLEQLPIQRAVYEILEDRKRLEEMFHCIIRGMAYPFGTLSEQVTDCLKCAGISYSRTVVSTENFDLPTDWLRLPATCHHNNSRLMELARKFINMKIKGAPQMFYLWGHSYEFVSDGNWNVIEEFAELIGKRDDIWYATNIEIFDYVSAYRQLLFDVNMTLVSNPTATDLYFTYDTLDQNGFPKAHDCCVRSGETLRLLKTCF